MWQIISRIRHLSHFCNFKITKIIMKDKGFWQNGFIKYMLSSYFTYNEMCTSVLRIIIYGQNINNSKNTEFFSPSFQKKDKLWIGPQFDSQIEFPFARIIPKHTRNPKIWNENKSVVKVNLNPKLVISTQCNYTSYPKNCHLKNKLYKALIY